MYSVGIDIGYSSVKVVLMNHEHEVEYSQYVMHKGRIKETLKSIMQDLLAQVDPEAITYGAVTGSGSKFLTITGEAGFINEATAIIEGSTAMSESIGSIIEIGGESAKYITGLRGKDKSQIEISMNSNCSAGTGSFLEEQMSRLNLSLEEYSDYASKAKTIPRIAGRCSVFAKTDITHHQQEGVAVEDILLGLAYALIRNYKGTVMRRLPLNKPVLFVGGVAHNQAIIRALNDVLNLAEGDLIIPSYFNCIGAVGVAVMAQTDRMKIDLRKLLNDMDEWDASWEESEVLLPKLKDWGDQDSLGKHFCKAVKNGNNANDCYLGIDIGSTSTNLVLMNEENEIVAYKYLRTAGRPVEAVKAGLKELKEEYGRNINVIGVGTTGSGRYMIGEWIGADVVKDEITAQAKAAVTIDPTVDTIFEIGGQDSKYISLADGAVTDFQMNKICAAGTGSFIEEQAKKFAIPIRDFGRIALDSENPVHLGERCTVFIESSIAANMSRGAELEDIAAGLCYSIVKNYLSRVVGQKEIGNKVFLQGGLAFNQGVVNAFRALIGKEIAVPPFFSVTGAYGVAILAKEEMGYGMTRFKGFDVENEKSVLTSDNGRPAAIPSVFDEKVRNLLFAGYDGSVDRQKKTVGIPRALFTYGMFSMFNVFFKELGFNVVLSDASSEKTIELGQKYALEETCYPVKLITGHVAELIDKKIDYLFFPNLYTVDHPGSLSRQNYGCAYMQMASKLINQATELESRGIKLLAPTIAFSLGQEFMMKSFASLGEQLGKPPEETTKALQKGMEGFQRFEARIEENSQKVIKELKPDEKTFVLISKVYGVADPVLNMGIPDRLMQMGYKVISFYDLPEGDIFNQHTNMFWPFGQHILEPTQLIKHQPNLYAILLTHHGCGPDSVLSHYFREAMDGKPYLHIEVDEHSSGVGVITRIEAFINSLKKVELIESSDWPVCSPDIIHQEARITNNSSQLNKQTTLYIPYLYPYAEIFKEILTQKEIKTRVLPATSAASIELGRRFTITEEYFSLTALLGDVFLKLYECQKLEEKPVAFLTSRNEGTEVDGQYSRVLRTKLDEEGFENTVIVSPFWEDLLCLDGEDAEAICLGLLAGDLIRVAPRGMREKHLGDLLDIIQTGRFQLSSLREKAKEIYQELRSTPFRKRLLVTGELPILYNDYLNNFTLNDLEVKKRHRIIYSSYSEAMWMMWSDYADQNSNENTMLLRQRLDEFKNAILMISECLAEESAFENDLEKLIKIADESLGYYAGAHGRYREAKLLGELKNIDGIITISSMYENTGIVMNVLHKEFNKKNILPFLHLTFDGYRNEHDQTKIDSFIYYL